MSKWKPGDLPNSIGDYGIDHQIWTDRDVIKFTLVAFALGFFIGVIV